MMDNKQLILSMIPCKAILRLLKTLHNKKEAPKSEIWNKRPQKMTQTVQQVEALLSSLSLPTTIKTIQGLRRPVV
jgi:predicted SPOUT superfamily RNA methylase MTH1